MKVVSNASPLILLAKSNLLPILPQVASEVLISEEVFQEVAGSGNVLPGATVIRTAAWLKRRACSQRAIQELRERFRHLGLGEISAILLAKETQADLLLMDDQKGRRLAKAQQLPVVGTAGVLELAFNRGILSDLRASYAQLVNAGLYINKELINASLARFNLQPL